VLITRIRPPDCPIADQRLAPEVTTRRASATATSAVGRVAWTTSASGMRYWGEGVGAAPDGGASEGLVGSVGGDDTGLVERSGTSPDAWQPASIATARATEAAPAFIRPA
jgi:hypothetical protein